jgi:type II secretory pathway pseudopilin PulG
MDENTTALTARYKGKVRQAGFSLVEITLVLVIAALALGTGLSLLTARAAQARIDSTRVKTEAVRQALVNFVAQNSRLPCPAAPGLVRGVANYNVERRNPAPVGGEVCILASGLTNNIGGPAPAGVSRGTVPCTTLGLPEDTCIDAWGMRLTYFVQNTAIRLTLNTVSGMRGSMTVHSFVPPAAAAPANGLAPTGNQINACSATAGDNACNLAAVAMIISHGANLGGGFPPTSAAALPTAGAVSNYELENTDDDIQFIQNDYIEQGASSFDDIVVPLVPRDVISALSQLGAVKQPAVFMNERFDLIRQTLLQDAYTDATGSSPSRVLALEAESGAAAVFPFVATDFASCTAPTSTQVLPLAANLPALHAAGGLTNDVWGNAIRYRRVSNTISKTDACTVPLVLVSYGPDGVQSADDIIYSVTKTQVSSFVDKYGGW